MNGNSSQDRVRALSPACARYLDLLAGMGGHPDFHDLKKFRHHEWVQAATDTLLKSKDVREICARWSDSADKILSTAWKLSGLDRWPIGLFALGKLGAQELNLSSDVDLVAIAAESVPAEALKSFREFVRRVSEADEWGFALRLDFDLRPGGRFGPTISTLKEAENYYWTQGATWERLALVRLRPVTGDRQVLTDFQELAHSFIYRRFIDYTFLDDLKNLRTDIHNYYFNQSALNLKLSVGGIRDIELFCHALQVIHGGRNHKVRGWNTHTAIENLIEENVYDPQELRWLRDRYWAWRQLENEIQAVDDRQTHEISYQHPAAERFRTDATKVDQIVTRLLGRAQQQETLPDDSKQKGWLSSLGYSRRIIEDIWPRILKRTVQSTRKTEDERMRKKFLYLYTEQLGRHGLDRDLGMSLMDDFLRAIRAKAGFFSLFVNEPRLIRDLAYLFSFSPYLGNLLASRPELVDSFLLKAQAAAPSDTESLLEYLTEKRLLGEIFASTAFMETRNVQVLGHELSLNADQIAGQLLNHLSQVFNSAPIQILALGKWGGQELGLHSDLDFVFVCHAPPGPAEQKVARRFISHLTEPHRGGMIYQIDLRLRPSGKAGPLLIEYDRLCSYLANNAAPWERQSYLRARFIDGTSARDIWTSLMQRPITREELAQLRDIRQKLFKPSYEDEVSIKYAPGGLIDIEFTAQVLTLSLRSPQYSGTSTQTMLSLWEQTHPEDKEKIQELILNYFYFRRHEQLMRLVANTSDAPFRLQCEDFTRMAHILSTPPKELFDTLTQKLEDSARIVKSLDPIYQQH